MLTKLSPKSSGAINFYIDLLAATVYEDAKPTRHQIRKVRKRRMSVVNNFSIRGIEEQVIRSPLDLVGIPK